MFSKNTVLALLVLLATVTPLIAQSDRRREEWSGKMATHGGTAPQAGDHEQASDPDADDFARLEGTWRANGKFNGGNTDQILYTFGAGKNPNKGIVVHSDNLFFVAAPSCLTAQGVWRRTGIRSFVATDEAFCFDSTTLAFNPAGKIRFEIGIKLNAAGNQFVGTIHIDAFDPDGNEVFSDSGTLQGTRMQAEAPPEP
jgi:hypothetical protein